MMQPHPVFTGLNFVFAVLLALAGIAWLITADTFGVVMGLSGIGCGILVLRRLRWGYFAGAAWCFGLMKLAMDKFSAVYPSEFYKHLAEGLCFLGIILAIVLHEKVAIKKPQPATPDEGE